VAVLTIAGDPKLDPAGMCGSLPAGNGVLFANAPRRSFRTFLYPSGLHIRNLVSG